MPLPKFVPSRKPKLPSKPVTSATGAVWTTENVDALVVGDVVYVDEEAPIPIMENGVKLTGPNRAQVETSIAYGKKLVRVRARRRTKAVVIEAFMRKGSVVAEPTRHLRLEVIQCVTDEPACMLPVGRLWNLRQGSVNAKHLPKRVLRLEGSGPNERTDDAGQRERLERLRSAAGPDPIRAISVCANPLGNDQCTTIGTYVAEDILEGLRPVSEWLIAQLDGTMPIPANARDKDAVDAALEASVSAAYFLEAAE